jgi:hypothetical protein
MYGAASKTNSWYLERRSEVKLTNVARAPRDAKRHRLRHSCHSRDHNNRIHICDHRASGVSCIWFSLVGLMETVAVCEENGCDFALIRELCQP